MQNLISDFSSMLALIIAVEMIGSYIRSILAQYILITTVTHLMRLSVVVQLERLLRLLKMPADP